MALYLKYRPNNFKSIVWQEQVKDILQAEVKQDKLSSSYIFFWPRWTGKTSTARILAKAINCTWEWEKPCNKCENCKLIDSWRTLDFVEIDAASNTQVDKIREEIIDKALYPPTNLKKKIYIIDEVHMLSKSAFNALLKIMEEPPAYLNFILATTELHKVPETIISRCEVFNFKRISQENIISRLEYICKEEWFEYEKDGLALIWKISDGWLRDAIKYLEQVSIIWTITTENVSKFLWIAPERQITAFLNTISTNNLNDIFKEIEDLQNQWIDLTNFIKDILFYLDEHLLENIEENLKLINLFDEIYANIKLFPTPALAYKTVIWNKKIQFTTNNNTTKINPENKKENKKKNKKKIENTQQKKTTEVIETTKCENIKNKLISKLDSPIVKWIIKNFWEIDEKNWEIIIYIISETNFQIITQNEHKEKLETQLSSICPNKPIKIENITKEEYFEKQLNN